jgi:acetate kinase
MSDALLILNAGSSSIKFAVYPISETDAVPLITGKIAGIGRSPDFSARDALGQELAKDELLQIDPRATHEVLVTSLLKWLHHHRDGFDLIGAGHRIVHGGRGFSGPAMITLDVMSELDNLVSLAPLHQPHNLAGVRAVADWAPDFAQVACFDTSFHRTQTRLAQLFALPRRLTDEGIIRYGFHGLSYDYIASVLPKHLGAKSDGRVVVAHLGNGASMCALKNRQSVATTMGFTALDGLMMGRRCGTIDPGVVLHLMQAKGMTAAQVEHLLYRESGLLGVSGISNNMQVLQGSGTPDAEEAIDLYCYRAAGELMALAAANEGLDAIVFTAGIGEKSARVRKQICARLDWVGVKLNDAANLRNEMRISSDESKIDVLVVPTNEEKVIARATQKMIRRP